MSKKLVLFVEGPFDGPAVANLVNRMLKELPPELQGHLFADGNQAYKIGNVPKQSGSKKCQQEWLRRLLRVQLEKNLGGVLVVLDGDELYFEGGPFCPTEVARTLATRGQTVGAGIKFSLAITILRQEYESLLIAGASQLPGLKPGATIPADPEASPRGAKAWLAKNLSGGYKEASDQLPLTRALKDWAPLRLMRCFHRLESAVRQLAQSVVDNTPIATPESSASVNPSP